MNIWQHIRLAGAVVIIVSAFMSNTPLTILVGLLIQFVGVIGGVNNLEHRVTELEKRGTDHEEA